MIHPKFFIAFADLLLAYACFLCACLLRFFGTDSLYQCWEVGIFQLFCYLFIILFCSYFFEVYSVRKFINLKFVLLRTAATVLSAFFILSAVFYLFPALQFGRGLLFISLLLLFFALIGLRLLILHFSQASKFAARIFIIGTSDLAQKISEIIPNDNNIHSYVRFVACTDEHPVVNAELIIGDIKQLEKLIQNYRPQKLIMALTERRVALPLREIMHSKLCGVDVIEATTYYEQQMGCLLIENMQPSDFIYTQRFRVNDFMRSYKRIFDIILSSIGLFFTLPLLPVLALIVKIDSPGPIFFRQLRVGEGEVEYLLYKFRTMVVDAEENTGAVWAQKNDSRVTKSGKFLRKTRLDEIPQLFNVLKGEMSFIGPRPERMAFVKRLTETIPYYSTRHFVKPGVTGWAQVCYPYGASDEDALEKLRYDLFYIKNYSILLDFRIILDTIRVVTSGFGGR